MWQVIILGEIPGTSIQITFLMWAIAAPVLALGCLLVWCEYKRRVLSFWCIAASLYVTFHPKFAFMRRGA